MRVEDLDKFPKAALENFHMFLVQSREFLWWRYHFSSQFGLPNTSLIGVANSV